jgi:DNA-directed RNA polymerase specialized sigma24 family protein
LQNLIVEEESRKREQQQAQISNVLVAAIAELEPDLQEFLQLYYGQNLTQQEIAKQLDLKQYTVSRRLTKARTLLLKTLSQWTQEILHISLSSEVIESTSIVLEEWLQGHYQQNSLLTQEE